MIRGPARRVPRTTNFSPGKPQEKESPDDFTHCRITYFQFNLTSLAPLVDERSNEKPLFFFWDGWMGGKGGEGRGLRGWKLKQGHGEPWDQGEAEEMESESDRE